MPAYIHAIVSNMLLVSYASKVHILVKLWMKVSIVWGFFLPECVVFETDDCVINTVLLCLALIAEICKSD